MSYLKACVAKPASALLLVLAAFGVVLQPALAVNALPQAASGLPTALAATLDPHAAVSTSPAGRPLFVRNDCREDVNLALRYADLDDSWISDGWWWYRAGAASYPVNDEGRELRSNNAVVYFAAHGSTGRDMSRGVLPKTVAGREVMMREATVAVDSDGDYVVAIVCN